MNKCIIVGSGQSAKDFVHPNGVDVIAVNNSITRVPTSNYWFTLDPAGYNLKIINDKNIKAKKYVACPDTFKLPNDVIRCKRVENHNHSKPIWANCMTYDHFYINQKLLLV